MGQYTVDYGNKGQRLLNAFGANWESEEVNGVTKIDFAKAELEKYIDNYVIEHEAQVAVNLARENSISNNDFSVTIT